MGARKVRQRDLFDTGPQVEGQTLPPEVMVEALQLLTQWLHELSKTMVRESGDEQDRR
jgi:hypothetical protein